MAQDTAETEGVTIWATVTWNQPTELPPIPSTSSQTTTTPVQTTDPVSSTPTTPTTAVALPAPTPDEVFQQAYYQEIPHMRITDFMAVKQEAYGVCGWLEHQITPAYAAHLLRQEYLYTDEQAAGFVRASARAYCPQYGN